MNGRIKFRLVDHPNAMRAAMESVSGVSSLALDLEMENHYRHYGLHIALIQATKEDGATFIFDPLSGIDLAPLGNLLVSTGVEIIIHDADFDKKACSRIYGWKLNRFFDTKLAAQLCGFRRYGLGSLLKSMLRVETDKKFQRTNWLKRPLRKDALDYAARDTYYLFAIKNILENRLAELGRLEWAREEFDLLERFEDAGPEAPIHYRIKGSASLTPRQLAVLKELAIFRDRLAVRIGRPVHFVIKNDTLVRLAVSPPADARALKNVRSLHPAVYRAGNAMNLIKAVKRGLTGPEDFHPRRARRPASSPGYGARLKEMQKWRERKAAELDLEPYLLISNDILRWCARNPELALPETLAARIRKWQEAAAWDDFRRHFSIGACSRK